MTKELNFLTKLINYRLEYFLNDEKDATLPTLPNIEEWELPVKKFIINNKLTVNESLLLLIALAPHVQVDIYDNAIAQFIKEPSDFPKIGGVKGKNSRSFLPTGETALFLLCGDDVFARLQATALFYGNHFFSSKKILWLEELESGEPVMSGKILMSPDYIELFTTGKSISPQFNSAFPAKKIAPREPVDDKDDLSFNDIVLSQELIDQISELENWLMHNEDLMHVHGMGNKLKKGYRALFYGPPGTGKTFTAEILGNYLKKDVYKIDLSMIVSKYIGETEKNLEQLFARAEDKGWILFFDEADSLFGKRTNVKDAHDKYANQEVSYLLQRIEDYNGLIILATNMKNNIDDAFIRRFNSIFKFPFPDAEQRAAIWQKTLPAGAVFKKNSDASAEEVNLVDTVKKYELSGGNILNIVHYAGIKAVQKKSLQSHSTETWLTIYLSDVLEGIKRELQKEGKPFSY